MSFLAIFFIFTGEDGLACCFPPDGGICPPGKMVVAAAASTVVAGVVQAKTAASGVALFLRDTGQLVALSRAFSFISLVFI